MYDELRASLLAPVAARPTAGGMAATEELPRDGWRPYFDNMSKVLGTVEATIEVDGADLGAQIVAERLILTGMSYDNKDDVLVIGLDAPGGTPEEMEHLVEHPERILVASIPGPPAEIVFDIADEQQHQTIVRLERPPELPEHAEG